MGSRMPFVQFHPTGTMKSWVNRPGGYDGARLVEPVIMRPGDDPIEMDDFEANWLVGSYPENFSIEES